MIALQRSLKGTVPLAHTNNTYASLSLVSAFVCLSLSQEPLGHLGYVVLPNTKLNIRLASLKVIKINM